MMRVLVTMMLASALSSCYVLTGTLACFDGSDCPAEQQFCVDVGDGSGDRICTSEPPGQLCGSTADCEAGSFCTRDPDSNQFCTNFCDGENVCINGEACVDEQCSADCASAEDCEPGEDCFNDPNLALGCVPAGEGCGPVDDVVCLDENLLCESNVYGRCMRPQDAVGNCAVANSLNEPGSTLLFINEALPATCTQATFCLHVAAVVIRNQETAVDAGQFAQAADIFVAYDDDAGSIQAQDIEVINRVTDPGCDLDRCAVEFDVEGDINPVVIGIQMLQVDVDITNTACFTP
jgi:hypothetical protein